MHIDGSETDLRAPTIPDMSHISPFVSLRIDKLVKYRIPSCHYFGIHLDFFHLLGYTFDRYLSSNAITVLPDRVFASLKNLQTL